MRELIKILVFSVLIMLGFVGYTYLGIPLIVPEAPPKEEVLSGDMTMEQFTALGDKIYNGKGTCTLCHNPVGGRAPILDTAAVLAADRLKDARYKGEAKTPEEYLRESLIKPSGFVVTGFGKRGTNDTESPMPDVSRGAIGLSPVEINAVIAYLQTLAGTDVTVPLPTAADGAPTGTGPEDAVAEVALAKTASEAFAKYECITCHIIPGVEEGGEVGPDLNKLKTEAAKKVKGQSAELFVIDSIVNPDSYVANGFDPGVMPTDYPSRVNVGELMLMVDALLGKQAANAPADGGK